MKQHFVPNYGRIVVVHEGVERMTRSGLQKPDEAVERERFSKQWAMVVGVGGPSWEYGKRVTTDYKEGDKVAVAQVGVHLELESSEGERDHIYVVPFEGVLGRVEARCEGCGYVERVGGEVMTLVCPKCGDGPANLVEPSIHEVVAFGRDRNLPMRGEV